MKYFLCLTIALFFLSCTQTEDNVLIRVKNVSQFNFNEVIVNTSDGENFYADINRNETTTYKPFDIAYRYAFVELRINGDIFTIQPLDYVGEVPLSPGKYTYEINATQGGDHFSRLSLNFVED
jgi:hypothetical protein